MPQQLNKNSQIEVNGISAVLLDERAKEGIFVDTEDLETPTWRGMDSKGYTMPLHKVVRFKQPDRMEVATACDKCADTKGCAWLHIDGECANLKQIFILKEKRAARCKRCNEAPPLTKEYSMNEIEITLTDRLKNFINLEELSDEHRANLEYFISVISHEQATSPNSSSLPSVKPIPDVEQLAEEAFKNVGDEGLFPNHSDKDIWISGFIAGTKSQSLNPWVSKRIEDYKKYLSEHPEECKVYNALISELETILITQLPQS